MKKRLLILILLNLTLLNAATIQEVKEEAKSAIFKLKTTLGKKLKKNIKKGGPEQAAIFCSHQAMNLTHSVNISFANNTHIRRISLKERNSENSPKSDEKEVLLDIQQAYNSGKTVKSLIVKKIYDDTYKVYKPIFINKKVCLKCHGEISKRDKKAYTIIQKDYPHDKAINYKMGDLRGAFVVTIVKK